MNDRPDITIPEEARVAGWDAFRAGIDLQLTGPQVFLKALEAAAPLIVAAEFERLADEYVAGTQSVSPIALRRLAADLRGGS